MHSYSPTAFIQAPSLPCAATFSTLPLPSSLSSSSSSSFIRTFAKPTTITTSPSSAKPSVSAVVALHNLIASLRRDTKRTLPSDFRSVTTPDEFTPHFPATVISVTPLTPRREYVELLVDTSHSPVVSAQHIAPGQTLRLARPDGTSRSVVAVISSPPQSGPVLRFLLSTAAQNDPCKLASLKPGDDLLTGCVSGSGIAFEKAANEQANLFLFVDAPQAFAVVTSLVEWPAFRAMTGEGANRTTAVTVFYSLPRASGIPYASRFSSWCTYAVNIVPLQGVSISEFMSARPTLSQMFGHAPTDYAVCAVTRPRSYEALFNSLVLLGFRRPSISRFTEDDVAAVRNDYNQPPPSMSEDNEQGVTSEAREFHSMPEAVYAEYMRQKVEREVWQSWVGIRDEMRREFERTWAAEARSRKGYERSEKEKRQAWASWAARNDSQWTDVRWESDSWNNYWGTWSAETASAHTRTNSRRSNRADNASGEWSEQNWTEFWDWDSGKTKGKGKEKNRGNSWHGWNNRQSKSSDTWGNHNNRTSNYQQSGYRYEYDGTASGRRSSSSGSGRTGWNGRNKWTDTSSSSSSSSSSRAVKLDLYAVLGVNASASKAELKKAYRAKAMQHHPDRNAANVEAATVRMKQVVVAWTVLKNEGTRRTYDMYGDGGL